MRTNLICFMKTLRRYLFISQLNKPKKMNKKKLIILLIPLLCSGLFAQNQTDSLPKRHVGISLNAGTTGIGGSLNFKLAKRIELSFGYNVIDVSAKLATSFDGQTVDLTVANKNNYTSVIFNLYPSVNSSFHFLLGALYGGNQFSIKAISKDSQDYGKIIFSPEQLGILNFNLKGSEWMPMAGIGFGRAIPNKRLGLGMDIGAIYLGSLSASIEASKAFEPTNDANNVKVLNQAFSDFQWLPFINFRLNIKLF
jgi:hypothetical protein